MTIIGEISNFRAWNNTIYYFSLSDGSNTAEFTMPVKYADPLIRQTGLKDGMQVIVQALKPRYRRTGRLQIDVTRITPVGAGILEQQLQMLITSHILEALITYARISTAYSTGKVYLKTNFIDNGTP